MKQRLMLRRTYVLSLLYASTAALLLLLAGAPAASLLAQAAGISSPGPGAAIVGDVPIIGTAVIDSFQKYELHYKQEPSSDDAYIYFTGGTLTVGDRIVIKTAGRGMKLLDFPGVLVKKAGPNLVESWGLRKSATGKLQVPVVATIPAHIMGSGAELTPEFVDQDLMTGDRAALAEHGIDNLKLGDLVAVMDTDHRYGRGYRAGGVTIGLIMHGDSVMTGTALAVRTCSSAPPGRSSR